MFAIDRRIAKNVSSFVKEFRLATEKILKAF